MIGLDTNQNHSTQSPSIFKFISGIIISLALIVVTLAIGYGIYLAFVSLILSGHELALTLALFPILPSMVLTIALMIMFLFFNWLTNKMLKDSSSITRGLKVGYLLVILIPVIFTYLSSGYVSPTKLNSTDRNSFPVDPIIIN